MKQDWKQVKERSSPLTVELIVWIALHLGRGVARLLLWPIVAYFFVTAGDARRASRNFLRRAGAPHGLGGVYRNLFAFAACGLDRVFLLAGRNRQMRVAVHDPDGVLPQLDSGTGAIVPTAHFGSFEALRVVGAERKGIHFRIVMDVAHGGTFGRVLKRLNPHYAAEIIDSAVGGPQLTLALHDALRKGCVIGLMADRLVERDPGVAVDFLGGRVTLPSGPWRLAAVLGAPVVLCFGLYRGGAAYELHFERFLDGGAVPRAQRNAFAEDCARRYAARLEHYVRLCPYNWFNFYDFWGDAAADGGARREIS